MCIRIVRLKEESEYDSSKPLEEQIRGCKQVVVNYEPSDPSIDRFFDEVERLCKNGISASLNIQFNHNNHLKGARLAKNALKLSKDLDFNEFIKMIALIQSRTDRMLEEMSELCIKR